MNKIKFLLAVLIFAAATLTSSLLAQTKQYYATMEVEGQDTVLYIRAYNKKPDIQENKVIYVGSYELSKRTYTINNLVDEAYGRLSRSNQIKRAVFEVNEDFKPIETRKWFEMFSRLEKIEGLEKLNTSSVEDMYYMFKGCSSLKDIDVSRFNTANVTNMAYMFDNCSSLKKLSLRSFNTNKVTTMYAMFDNCSSLESIDVSSFNTEKVTSMYRMFESCSSLESIDISSFNTENVTEMSSIFSSCTKLKYIFCDENSRISTKNANGSVYCFWECYSLKGVTSKGEEVNWNRDKYGLESFVLADNGGYITKKTSETIEIKDLTKTTYRIGEELDFGGAYILRTVKNFGQTEASEFKYPLNDLVQTIKGFDNKIPGKQTVSLTYGGKELSFEIEVVDYLKEVLLVSQPEVNRYLLPFTEADLNLSGGVIKKVYASDSVVEYAMDTLEYKIKNELNLKKQGKQDLDLSFNLGDTTFEWVYEIELVDSVVTIKLISGPEKTQYKIGEDLKVEELFKGIVLSAQTNAGREETLYFGDLVDNLLERIDSGKVSLEELEEGTNVIDFIRDAAKQEFNLEIDLFSTEAVGIQKLTFKYEELECSCDIEVVDYLTEVLVAAEPSLKEYKLPVAEEDLNLAGGVIKKAYASGDSVEYAMDMLEFTVDGLEGIEVGENILVLSFDLGDTNFAWKYKINVLEGAAEDSTGGDDPGEGGEGGDDPIVAVEAAGFGGGAVFEAWTSGGVLYVSAARGGVLEVLGVNGVLVRREEVAAGGSASVALEKGVYVLRFGGEVKKVVVE